MAYDDKNPEPDNNVWASYSDLFTNVAVVFLVMFVFALIKSTVTQFKTSQTKKQHEAELRGKLSEKDVKKNKERIAKVEESVEEMKKYEEVIDEKVKELNEYAKKLQANKKVIKEVLEAQTKQDTLIKAAEEKLLAEQQEKQEKQMALEEAKLRITLLNEELQRAQLEVKQREDTYQKKLASTQETTSAQALKLTETIKELNEKLKKARTESSKLETQLKTKIAEDTDQANMIKNLQEELASVEKNYEATSSVSKKLSKERKDLQESLTSLSAQHIAMKREYESLQGKYKASDSSSKELSEKLASLNEKLQQMEGEAGKWKNDFEKKLGEADRLKKELADSQRRLTQLAKTMTDLKDKVKNNVAVKLQDKFKEQGLAAQVNPKTGEVVLLSGEGVNFAKGSSELSSDAKKLLKKLIPVYSEVLLGDADVLRQISSISMEGHSSPTFSGKVINTEEDNPIAYSFNMRLSAMRAASVANYLMSKEIGPYPNKDKMKILLQSVGFGHMKPVPKEISLTRAPASASEEECGPWDCLKSQRVQMNFLLKDNMDEIHKIIDANGGIK